MLGTEYTHHQVPRVDLASIYQPITANMLACTYVTSHLVKLLALLWGIVMVIGAKLFAYRQRVSIIDDQNEK